MFALKILQLNVIEYFEQNFDFKELLILNATGKNIFKLA